MRLLVATRSAGKIVEIRRILHEAWGGEVVSLEEAGVAYDPVEEELEPHDTFELNAISKARYFMERTGLSTVADDSGLEVLALGGAPGVRTKRFAPVQGLEGRDLDEANNAHLLSRLQGVPAAERGCRYVCVAALVGPGGSPVTFRGEAVGLVGTSPRGDGGFGYDPIIRLPDGGRTFAELASAEKDERSHRGAAFRALGTWLRDQAVEP